MPVRHETRRRRRALARARLNTYRRALRQAHRFRVRGAWERAARAAWRALSVAPGDALAWRALWQIRRDYEAAQRRAAAREASRLQSLLAPSPAALLPLAPPPPDALPPHGRPLLALDPLARHRAALAPVQVPRITIGGGEARRFARMLLVPPDSGPAALHAPLRQLQEHTGLPALLLLSCGFTAVLLAGGSADGSWAYFTNRQLTAGNYMYTYYLDAPTNLQGTVNGSQISVTWSANSPFAIHQLMVSTTSGSGYVTVGSGSAGQTSASYTPPGPGTYYFIVRAQSGTYWVRDSAEIAVVFP